MNNKDFISELSKRVGFPPKETSEILESVVGDMAQQLQDGKSINIQGFGSFEVKKKAERISINPVSKLRMLVPPKLVVAFKPGTVLKDKFK